MNKKLVINISMFFLMLLMIIFITLDLSGQNDYSGANKDDIKNSKSTDPFQMAGKYIKHYENEKYIDFQCKNARVRLEICAEDILRIRMNPSGNFKPDEPWVVIRYNWPKAGFTVEDKGAYIAVKTNRILVKAFKSPFRFEIFDLVGKPVCKDWKEGGMGFRGEEVLCKKELTETDHFFGLGQRYEKSDLRGIKTTCLVTREYTPVPFFMGTDGYGIFFHSMYQSVFDFSKNPYCFSAPGGGELDYYFIYGPDFKHILDQYTKITGKSPLPPKWAFGLFFSRWDEKINGWKYRQDGQEGMLRTIQAAREVWDWPLDGIRVHSTGPEQNIYASPNTAWPAGIHGEFPAVDQMVKKLHEQHIHPLFWEAPGVHMGCKMYEEGVSNNYFLTLDGKPFNTVFGYGSPPGGLVDFLNPEARKWWGKYHNYMVDFGSDGVAGDWNAVNARGKLISPSTGLYAEEFVNIYSFLFNQAGWDAYKERNPGKRSITFGLVYWAGGQRYPMQGTQDSHAMRKNIYGEMMSCINLSLSGIPFRTFTDNVSRIVLPALPLSRLSQYLSLTVAGERTEIAVTGDPMADWNYRYYGKLRYRLMPYIYTYARETTKTGSPLIRALVLEYQNDPNSYDAYCEYLLGRDLLIAPLWSDTTFNREIYLPEGKWFDFFNDTIYEGRKTINYLAPIDHVPILVKAGAIIPMAPENQKFIDEIKSPFTVQIYPSGKTSFDLYEDDGESYDYEKGVFTITGFSCEELVNELIIKKNTPEGSFKIPDRNHIFCIHKNINVNMVQKEGRLLIKLKSIKEFNDANEGWMYDKPGKKLWIKVNNRVTEAIELHVFGI